MGITGAAIAILTTETLTAEFLRLCSPGIAALVIVRHRKA
jgi:hypothetical protein